MQNAAVRKYYNCLADKKASLMVKRIFDIAASSLLLLILSPAFLLLALIIKLDSRGPVFYRQIRVTQYGRLFRIHKFRSMVQNADKSGTLITIKHDCRITRVGRIIRKFRIDETSQLIDVLLGDMTFVGMRPEVPKYVEQYTPVMMATLLLPAGVTSDACIFFKDEAEILNSSEDIDRLYVSEVLPAKMQYCLMAMEKYTFMHDLGTLIRTALAVLDFPIKPKSNKGTVDEVVVQGRKL
ncbi:MAG: sugar transferase [Oscillospiraceae bacterium]|nr:sugar transferase [Oscillospiraceae bacterium]